MAETSTLDTLGQKGITKMHIALIIVFVISLVIIIIAGRILNMINLSTCKKDPKIISAHKWAAWTVGIFSAIATLALAVFVITFFMNKSAKPDAIKIKTD